MDSLRKNHFELLGLAPRFGLDEILLEQAFRKLQIVVHPDRFAAGTPQERRLAMQMAAQVNEAYRCLRDPIRRGVYLCELAGVATGEHTNTAMPVDFLQEQMSWRESLEALRDSRDRAGLESLRDKIQAECVRRIDELQRLFDHAGDVSGAALALRQLMFVDRFAEQVAEALDALG